jgi:hypothetical protein
VILNPKRNAVAADPTVNDDVTAGYSVGSIWVNTSDAGVFVCISSGAGAADWNEVSFV